MSVPDDASALDDTRRVLYSVRASDLYYWVTHCEDADVWSRLQSFVQERSREPDEHFAYLFTWRDSMGNTCLHALLQLPDTPATRECLSLLLSRNDVRSQLVESCNSCYQTPLTVAVLWNHVFGVRALLDVGASTKVVYHETFLEALNEVNPKCFQTDGILPGPDYGHAQTGTRVIVTTHDPDVPGAIRMVTRVERDEMIVRMIHAEMHQP